MKITQFIVICLLCFLIGSCKHDVAGCADIEATNWDTHANLNDGSCKYKPLILNSSFEKFSDWMPYSGSQSLTSGGISNKGDGFMPTNGNYFLQCVPLNYQNSAAIRQFILNNKHYKGFYFDYSCKGVVNSDSLLIAQAGIGISLYGTNQGSGYILLWTKLFDENTKSNGGKTIINLQKRDEYVELPYTEYGGEFSIGASITKGTFTFQVDNIREVQR